MIWMNDDIETTKLSSSKLFGSYTSKTDSLPYFWNVSFFSGIICLNVFFIHYENLGKLLVVAKFCEDNFGCFVHLVVEAFLSNLRKISLVWLSYEIFKFDQAFFSALGISINEL